MGRKKVSALTVLNTSDITTAADIRFLTSDVQSTNTSKQFALSELQKSLPIKAVIDTFASGDLQALDSDLADGSLVAVKGWNAVGDGGEGFVNYDASSTATVDNGLTFDGLGGTTPVPGASTSTGTGRFTRVLEGNAGLDVKWFGAVGDGVADDTDAIQAAFAAGTGGQVVLPDATYLATDTLTVPTGTKFIGIGTPAISVAEGWANKPVLSVGSQCLVSDLSIVETNASPTNAAKDQAGNIGLSLASATDSVIERVYCKGFNFPICLRAAERIRLTNCTASHGYAWGFEVDSSPDVIMRGCESYTNGYHGIKTQNEYAATCDGFVLDSFLAYDNGQRSTAAGGAESNAGVGISLYHGGYRYSVVNCTCRENYGSGFSQKGGGVDPVQGEGFISGCNFIDNLLPYGGGAAHGIELAIGGGTGASLLHISNCNLSGNGGDGFHVQAGYGITVDQCNAVGNDGNGFTLYHCTDVSLSCCNAFANATMGMRLGYSNGGTYLSRRWKITDCVVAGNYNDSLADWADPRTTATAKESDYGIAAYSDSTDITFARCHVYNIAGTGQSMIIYSGRTTLQDCVVYGAVRNAYQITSPSCTIDGGTIQETDFSSSAYYGSVYIAAGSVVDVRNVTFVQSALTANSKCIHAAGMVTVDNCTYTNFTTLETSDGAGTSSVIRTTPTTVPTTDATVTTLATLATSSDRVYHVRAVVFATETAAHDEVASYELVGTFQNDGGTLTQVGATSYPHFSETTAGWDCAFSVSSPNVLVRVTGAVATLVNWKCKLTWEELT